MSDSDPSRRNEPSEQKDTPPRSGETQEGLMARLLRAFGVKSGTAREELEEVLEEGATAAEAGFSPQEQALLKNILELRERRIEDVMLPRAHIIAVPRDISLGDLVRVFENAGHSRLVVYNDSLDDPAGMVHIRDLIAFLTTRAAVRPDANAMRKRPLAAGLDLRKIDLSLPLSATEITRKLLFVPPTMPAIDLLAKMQQTHIHLALVIDEYGGTDGLVSMEDIVELIVGDIADEHDEEDAPSVLTQANGTFIADARASLEDVAAAVGPDFDVGDATEEVDTLSGYVVMLAGHVPVRGEVVAGPAPFEIEVLDADPRRVKRVRITNTNARRLESKRRGPATAGSAPAPAANRPEAAAAAKKGARGS
jgi:CBS domain containing-hemolysin-like protein